MTDKFFHYFIRRTHFWRTVSISEMAELYSSRMLRVMAMNMLGGFGGVYLYQLGYSIDWLAWYYVVFFVFRVCTAWIAALIVARYGPKHSISISNVLFILATILLASVPMLGFFALLLLIPVGSFGRALYDVAYMVDFSKVKHVEHSGKEIGLMQIIERCMIVLGPIIGGLVALLAGPVAMMLLAAVLMLFSAIPLFFSSEPVKVHQKLTLRHFNLKVAWKPMLAQVGVGMDMNASGWIWHLMVVVAIFGVVNNASYLQIGILSSTALVSSIAVAYVYGKLVDNHRGKELLRFGVIGDFLLYLLRPLVGNPIHVVGINIANEAVTSAYNIPAIRGIFDTADGLPGYRIVYITVMYTMLSLGDTLGVLALAILTVFLNDADALRATYWVIAPFLLLIGLHTTAIYRRGILTRFIHRV